MNAIREVLAGQKSPHAAMVEAGFRKPTASVPVEPQAVAQFIRRKFTADEIRQIIRLLSE